MDIAKKNNGTPAQVLLAWGMKRGYSVIPKSVTPARIISNFQTFQLNDQEFKIIDDLTLNGTPTRLLDPSPFWGVDIYGENKSKL